MKAKCMSENKKIIYYQDELNDDFAEQEIDPVKIDGSYKYIHKNPFWNIAAFIVYRLIALPLACIYSKRKFNLKIENKAVLKKCKNSGYFLYINHTQEILDTLTPTLTSFPKRAYIVAHPNNISIKGLKTANKMMGALPIPGDMESSKNFLKAISEHIAKKRVIAIYPEAHVWPYYTKIRDFKDISFKYPVKLNAPVYSVTCTYKEGKKDKPDIVIYIDGPFYPDNSQSIKDAEKALRDTVYNKMIERSKNSTFEYIKYVKKDDISETNVKLTYK